MQGKNRYRLRCMRESGEWEGLSTLGSKNSHQFLDFEIQYNNLPMHKMQS